jgi:hypothetical protein
MSFGNDEEDEEMSEKSSDDGTTEGEDTEAEDGDGDGREKVSSRITFRPIKGEDEREPVYNPQQSRSRGSDW